MVGNNGEGDIDWRQTIHEAKLLQIANREAMDIKAAVAFEVKAVGVETVRLDGPQDEEALIETRTTGMCHTDAFTLSGADAEELFPSTSREAILKRATPVAVGIGVITLLLWLLRRVGNHKEGAAWLVTCTPTQW